MKEKELILNCIKKQITKIENNSFKILQKQQENELKIKQLNQVELYVRTHLNVKRGEKVVFICEECGKEFFLYKWRASEYRKFCSRDCANKHRGKLALGKHLANTTNNEIKDFLGIYSNLIYYFINQYCKKYNINRYADEIYSEFLMRLPNLLDYQKNNKTSNIKNSIEFVVKHITIKQLKKIRNEDFIDDNFSTSKFV